MWKAQRSACGIFQKCRLPTIPRVMPMLIPTTAWMSR